MGLENIKVTGRLKVDKIINGEFIEGEWRNNVVTTVGKNSLASLLNSASAGNSFVTQMGFGSSSTVVAAGDTALGSELVANGYSRTNVTVSNPTANQIQYVSTLTGLSASTTINEAGLFNGAGTLIAHQLTGATTLSSSSDSLQVTWQVTFS